MNRVRRLTGRRCLDAVQSTGVAGRGEFVRVRALGTTRAEPRAAIAVRGARTAVERNRARRRLRAATEAVLADSAGLDVLVSAAARSSAVTAFPRLREDIATALLRARRHAAEGKR
jgi:ribonuclease P protein component